ncbi:MAG: hypothetical protein ACRELY_31505 [Polyangiaceae bacterium]
MRTAVAIAFLSLGFLAGTARADSIGEAVQLSWNAPDGCPSRDAVMSDVARILGATTTHHASVRADVTELGPERWSVHLVTTVDGAPGERSLEANSCEAVASATALIVAWTVDPARARAQTAPAPAPAPTPTQAPAPAPTRNPRRVGERASTSEPIRAVVALDGVGALGVLPSAGFAGELSLGVLAGPLRVELAGADWISEDATAPSGEGTHIHLYETALDGCYRGKLGERLELDPCAGGAIFFASSDGFGESQTFQRTSSWGSLEAELLTALRIAGPLALRGSLGLGVPLTRPPFVLLQPGGGDVALHRVSLVTAQATIGLEARFP